uniref:Uncharacterized protein n=1 Tax=Arundo donax TaxID=35708 RepID=A0A0A9DI34_ARUDO
MSTEIEAESNSCFVNRSIRLPSICESLFFSLFRWILLFLHSVHGLFF